MRAPRCAAPAPPSVWRHSSGHTNPGEQRHGETTRAALRNGITPREIKEVFIHVATYCGAPAAIDSFRVAKKILAEKMPRAH
jgi:hypothetical protein